jgi:uncharacterized protein YktB (UPF0637 family)
MLVRALKSRSYLVEKGIILIDWDICADHTKAGPPRKHHEKTDAFAKTAARHMLLKLLCLILVADPYLPIFI